MLKIIISLKANRGNKSAKMEISYPNKEDYEKANDIEKMACATIQAKLNETFSEN